VCEREEYVCACVRSMCVCVSRVCGERGDRSHVAQTRRMNVIHM